MKPILTSICLACFVSLLAGCTTWNSAGWSPRNWFKSENTDSGELLVSARPLAGTRWILDALGGAPLPPEARMTFDVASDGKVAGRAGCNSYFAKAEIGAASLVNIAGVSATKMACSEVLMNTETQFLNALNRTRSYRIGEDDDRLRLMDSSGAVLLVFKRS